eukprot:scaffold19417_cov56-Phaeocystis_antarctica.AAC.3
MRHAVSLLRLCRGRIDERVAPSTHGRLRDEGERRANEEAAVEEADHQRAGAAPLRRRHGLGRIHEGARGEPAIGEREGCHHEQRPRVGGEGRRGRWRARAGDDVAHHEEWHEGKAQERQDEHLAGRAHDAG